MSLKIYSKQNISCVLFGGMIFISLAAYHPSYFIPDTFKWLCIAFLSAFLIGGYALNLLRKLVYQKASISFDLVDIGMLVFTAYAALSLMWTPDCYSGLLALINWLMLLTVLVKVKNTEPKQYASDQYLAILLSVSAATAVGLATHYFHPERWGGFYNENFFTEFLLLALPFLAGLIAISFKLKISSSVKYLLSFFAIVLLSLVLFHLLVQNPSKLEFFVLPSAFIVLAGLLFWRVSRLYTALIVSLLLIGLSVLIYMNWGVDNGYKASLLSRAALNFNTLQMWWHAPILGNGVGSFSYIFPSYQELHFQYFPQLDFSIDKFGIAKAAHNEYLEFLSGFGIVGLVLLSIPVLVVCKAFNAQEALIERHGVWVVLCVLLFVATNAVLEYPLQNPATALLTVIAFGFFASSCNLAKVYRIQQQWICALILVLLLIATVGLVFSAYRVDASQKAYRKMAEVYYVDPQTAFEFNAEAHRLNPLDFRARVQLYESLVHWNRALGAPPLAPSEYDAVYWDARKAGPQALMMLRRVEYLLDTGRYQERSEEAVSNLNWLRAHFSRKADVWIADAYYHLLMGRALAASLSIAQARSLAHGEQEEQRILMLEAALRNQGAE